MNQGYFPLLMPPAASWLLFSAGFGGQPPMGGAPNPFSANPGMGAQPPRKKSNAWIWILGGIGVAGVLAVACCGGVSYFGFSAATKFLGEQLKQEVAGNADVQKHLGEVQSVTMNLMDSEKEGKQPGQQIFVFDVKGTTGSGQFVVEQSPSPQPGNLFQKIDLRLPSGETVSIK